jgi:hypothetical protein
MGYTRQNQNNVERWLREWSMLGTEECRNPKHTMPCLMVSIYMLHERSWTYMKVHFFGVFIYVYILYIYICIICMYNMYIYMCVYPVPHVWADATEIRMDYNWPTCVLNYYFTCLNEEMLRLVVTSYFNNSLLKLGFMGHFTSKNGGLEWSSFCNYNPWRCTYHYQPTISAENG